MACLRNVGFDVSAMRLILVDAYVLFVYTGCLTIYKCLIYHVHVGQTEYKIRLPFYRRPCKSLSC